MAYMLRALSLTVLVLLGSLSTGCYCFASDDGADSLTESTLLTLAPRLSAPVAKLALDAATCAALRSGGAGADKLAIIDYSRPSIDKRFWLFDLEKRQLLVEDLVAHGKGSGENYAGDFSNQPGSLKSSLGLFRIGQSYLGKHGPSLRLIGLEPGFNDLAMDRAIVIHGADYVNPSFIQLHQRLGRSFGCPALSPESARKTIETFSSGSGFLFSFYPDAAWLKNSSYLNVCRRV
jgi:hypothetical protein